MRFNIRCDMEGVTGVTSYEQVTLGNPRYEESRQALTRELLAVIEGIRSVAPGAEVVIFDEHMDGRNADVAQLPEGVAYVSGKPAYDNDDPGLIKGADAMLLVGFHSKAGTRGALLPHTYEHDILDLQVNGVSLGEVGVEAAIAGEAGVPTIFYSGDDAGGEEIAQLIPGIVRVAVKRSLGETAALCLGGTEVLRLLREQAAAAVVKRSAIEPFRVQPPVTLRGVLREGAYRDALRAIAPGAFDASGWLRIDAPSLSEAYATYSAWRAEASARVRRVAR